MRPSPTSNAPRFLLGVQRAIGRPRDHLVPRGNHITEGVDQSVSDSSTLLDRTGPNQLGNGVTGVLCREVLGPTERTI